MLVKRLELYRYKRFFLSQVDRFILEPKSNIMIMMLLLGSRINLSTWDRKNLLYLYNSSLLTSMVNVYP